MNIGPCILHAFAMNIELFKCVDDDYCVVDENGSLLAAEMYFSGYELVVFVVFLLFLFYNFRSILV